VVGKAHHILDEFTKYVSVFTHYILIQLYFILFLMGENCSSTALLILDTVQYEKKYCLFI